MGTMVPLRGTIVPLDREGTKVGPLLLGLGLKGLGRSSYHDHHEMIHQPTPIKVLRANLGRNRGTYNVFSVMRRALDPLLQPKLYP